MYVDYHRFRRIQREQGVGNLLQITAWSIVLLAVGFLVGYLLWQFTHGPSAGTFPKMIDVQFERPAYTLGDAGRFDSH